MLLLISGRRACDYDDGGGIVAGGGKMEEMLCMYVLVVGVYRGVSERFWKYNGHGVCVCVCVLGRI